MKQHILLTLLLLSTCVYAQAPDFSATDIDGTTHSLYEDYLDQGKYVLIDFSATWCAPCWGLHSSKVLENAFDTYGPHGGDIMAVLFVETDSATDMDDLLGNTAASQGNWIAGTGYPIIDDGQFIAGSYGIFSLPSVRLVCPNGDVLDIDDSEVNNVYLLDQMIGCAEPSTSANDARIFYYNGLSTGCSTVDASVMVHNNGQNPITSLSIDAVREDNQIFTTNWSGNIPSNGFETIVLDDVSLIGTQDATDFVISITNEDANNENNSKSVSIKAVDAVLHDINVYIETDQWSSFGAYYEILDANGNVIVDKGNLPPNQVHEATYTLPADGCYTFQYEHPLGYGNSGKIQVYDANWTYAVNSNGFVGDNLISPLRADADAVGTSIHNISDVIEEIQIIRQNRSEVTIQFTCHAFSDIQLSLHSINGSLVADGGRIECQPGFHQLPISTSILPAGRYFVQLQMNGQTYPLSFVQY